MTTQHLEMEEQKELEILRKEKQMFERINNLRKTKGSIYTKFNLYVHDVTARYDDKIYITGSVKDSFYVKPRDSRKPDKNGSTYSKVHMMFRKSTINEREFPADFIRQGDIVEIEALLTHGFEQLKDSAGNLVLVDGKEVNVPTDPQYEGFSMGVIKLTDETRKSYKEYLDAKRESAKQKAEQKKNEVDSSSQTQEKPEEKVEQNPSNDKPDNSQSENTKPQSESNDSQNANNGNEPKGDSLDLGNLSFNWNS